MSVILIRPLAGAGRSQSRWVTFFLTLLETFAVACQGKGKQGFTQQIFNHNNYLKCEIIHKHFLFASYKKAFETVNKAAQAKLC